MDPTRLKLLKAVVDAEATHEQARRALAVVEAEASRCRELGISAHDRVYEECGRWRTQMNCAAGSITKARYKLAEYDRELVREGHGVN